MSSKNVLFQQQQSQHQYYNPLQQQQTQPPTADELSFQSFSYDQSQQSSTGAANNGYYYPPDDQNVGGMMTDMELSGGKVTWKSFRAAFSTGGFENEPPLLEELGFNFDHIIGKSLTVLNPWQKVDQHIMDDTDLAGPLLFCVLFGAFLLLNGKSHFGYIYGLSLVGWLSTYSILNLMSSSGIDLTRTASVLGYSLLPMVVLSSLSMLLSFTGLSNQTLSLGLSSVSVLWCTNSASVLFVTVLAMDEQRFLVAYPVGLLYTTFALLAVF